MTTPTVFSGRLGTAWDSWPALAPTQGVPAIGHLRPVTAPSRLIPVLPRGYMKRTPLSFLVASPLLLCSSTYWVFPPSAPFPVPSAPEALGQCHSLFSTSVHVQNYISDWALPTGPHTFSPGEPCPGRRRGAGNPSLPASAPLPILFQGSKDVRMRVTMKIVQHTYCALLWANDDGDSVFPQRVDYKMSLGDR